MHDSALLNSLRIFFVTAGFLIASAFLGFAIGSADYGPLLIGAIALIGALVWFASGRFFWVMTVASFFFGGTFPFLGGSFTPFQIMLMLGVAKFVFEDVVLRRSVKLRVDRLDVLLIAGFMLVLTLHGIHDRFGMRYLGSTVWGGRNYVNVYVGLVAFFVIQSMPMQPKLWNKLPFAILLVTAFDLSVAIFTRIFPSSIFRIFPFYSAVSQASIDELVMGVTDRAGRIGAFGNFGFILILIVLSTVTLRALFHPSNFFRLVTAGFGALCVLYSGFRSAVAQMLLGFAAAGIRDLRRGVLLLLAAAAALLFILSAVNSEVIRLPPQVQRAIAFMPGNWDPMMANDAAASNDFRMRVWSLWWTDYFPKQPIFGRGFGFKSEWTKVSVFDPKKTDFQMMVEVGNIHNGFFATLDAIGIAGTIFFVLWNVRLLVLCLKVPFQRQDPAGFAIRFLALYLAVTVVSYWGAATTIGNFLPGEFALAAVFLRLRREQPRIAKPDKLEAAPASERGFRRELVRI